MNKYREAKEKSTNGKKKKQRAVNVYHGRRRKRPFSKAKGDILYSSSAKKMELFGISLDNLETKMLKSSDSSLDANDIIIIAQYSSLASFFAKMLCPECKSPSCFETASRCTL